MSYRLKSKIGAIWNINESLYFKIVISQDFHHKTNNNTVHKGFQIDLENLIDTSHICVHKSLINFNRRVLFISLKAPAGRTTFLQINYQLSGHTVQQRVSCRSTKCSRDWHGIPSNVALRKVCSSCTVWI